MSSDPSKRRLDDETLLQWSLGSEPTAHDASSELTDADRDALADLDAFVSDCRADLSSTGDELQRDADRLVQSVLDHTVREDLGWRGDLRLVRGFMGRRLRSSLLLRVAAASLLVHLVALPVIAAYRVWKAEDPQPALWIELAPPATTPFAEDQVEDYGPAVEPELPELDSLDSLSLEVQNARNADRWSIFERTEELRAVAQRTWNSELEQRLAARAARLIGGQPAITAPAASNAHPLQRLMFIDEALDARLFGLPVPLSDNDLRWLVDEAAGDPPRAAVALAILCRAHRYGVPLPAGAAERLERLRAPEFAAFAGLTSPAGESPLSAEWVRALRSCTDSASLSAEFEEALRD